MTQGWGIEKKKKKKELAENGIGLVQRTSLQINAKINKSVHKNHINNYKGGFITNIKRKTQSF